MPIDFSNNAALKAFHGDTAVVTGKRREGGSTRNLGLTCRCCLLIGELLETSDHSFGAKAYRECSIEVLQSEWPDHMPPQKGDVFCFEGRGSATVTNLPSNLDGTYALKGTFLGN